MKSLEQIKNEYAQSKKFKSWENFCFVANDNMFVRAVDEIANLYAAYRTKFILNRSFNQEPTVTKDFMMERFG